MNITSIDEITVTQTLSGFVIEEQTIKEIILRKLKRTWYGKKTLKNRKLGSGSFNQIFEYSKDKVLRLSKDDEQKTSENELSFKKGQDIPEILVKVFAYGTVKVTGYKWQDLTFVGGVYNPNVKLELEWSIIERGKGSLYDEFKKFKKFKRKQLSLEQIKILNSHIDKFLVICPGGHGDLKPQNILVMNDGSFRIIDLPDKCPLNGYEFAEILVHILTTSYTPRFRDEIIHKYFLEYLYLKQYFTTDEDIQFVNNFFKYQDYFALIRIVLDINGNLELLVNPLLRNITEFCVGFIDELYKRIFAKDQPLAKEMAKEIFKKYCVGEYPRCSYNAFLGYFINENKESKQGGSRIKNKRTKKKYRL